MTDDHKDYMQSNLYGMNTNAGFQCAEQGIVGRGGGGGGGVEDGGL